MANLWQIFVEWFLMHGDVRESWRMVFGELTRWRVFDESLGNGFWRTNTLANIWLLVFGELTRWRIFDKSLGNGFWRTDTLANLWRLVFGELSRWRIISESLGNVLLAN